MEKQSVEAIASKVVDLIQSSDAKQVTGVRLGVQIREAFQSFSPSLYRCKNLRQFVTENIPAVRVISHKGPEVIYGLSGEDAPQPTRWKVRTPEWKTFTTPRARY